MAIKFDIAQKGKTFHTEAEVDLSGMKIGDKIKGEDVDAKFSGYEFEITGLSDTAGFPSRKDVEGVGRKRMLLKRGIGMKEKGRGLILRKIVRGNTISAEVIQINLKVVKEGKDSIAKLLGKEEKPAEKAEEKKEEKKEWKARTIQ